MTEGRLRTPVAFFIFNRPDTIEKVFAEIAKVKPTKLLVIADGPRDDRYGEAEKCVMARAVIDRLNWDCEVVKNYSDINLGCGLRVSTGINWVFEQVDEAIILEDDCLPHPTFFQFCSELLRRYRDNDRVMMISGTNLLGEWKSHLQSYHFSYYGGIWGWASWRRAWDYYDYDMKLWEHQEVRNHIRDVLADDKQFQHRAEIFCGLYRGDKDTWDYQWSFARLARAGLSIVPSVNLISNIGFNEEATHTTNPLDMNANLALYPISFPLKTPEHIAVDREYDLEFFLRVSGRVDNQGGLRERITNRLLRLMIVELKWLASLRKFLERAKK